MQRDTGRDELHHIESGLAKLLVRYVRVFGHVHSVVIKLAELLMRDRRKRGDMYDSSVRVSRLQVCLHAIRQV